MLAYILAMFLTSAPTCTTARNPVTHISTQTCGGRITARWDDAGEVRLYLDGGRILTRVGGEWVVL